MPGFNQQDGQQLTPDVIARRLNALELPLKPYILGQSGVPVILPSSGSSNASGQITLTTALPSQPAGVVGLYLPAGVVVGDAAGGIRQVVFSSTTVCQIVGNPVTANGAYTQTTNTDLTLVSMTVPGGALGANGSIRVSPQWSVPGNANVKSSKVLFGGQGVANWVNTTSTSEQRAAAFRNRGALNSQITSSFFLYANAASSMTPTNIDTSVQQPLTLTGQLTVATDYVILESYLVEVLPAN